MLWKSSKLRSSMASPLPFVASKTTGTFAVASRVLVQLRRDRRTLAMLLVLPCVVLASFYAARIARLTRSSVLDTLNEEYVLTARAKGLAEWIVIGKHTLKNSAIPIVTLAGLKQRPLALTYFRKGLKIQPEIRLAPRQQVEQIVRARAAHDARVAGDDDDAEVDVGLCSAQQPDLDQRIEPGEQAAAGQVVRLAQVQVQVTGRGFRPQPQVTLLLPQVPLQRHHGGSGRHRAEPLGKIADGGFRRHQSPVRPVGELRLHPARREAWVSPSSARLQRPARF